MLNEDVLSGLAPKSGDFGERCFKFKGAEVRRLRRAGFDSDNVEHIADNALTLVHNGSDLKEFTLKMKQTN